MKNEPMIRENGGRTHEPSHRELVAELDGLRELLDERNKWYGERDKDRQTAVDKALAAVEKQTAAAFEAAKEASVSALTNQKEAVIKQEDAQKSYNVGHNDLLRKLDEQNKATMPRSETESRFFAIDEKINDLRESRSGSIGKGVAFREFLGYIIAAAALIFSFLK